MTGKLDDVTCGVQKNKAGGSGNEFEFVTMEEMCKFMRLSLCYADDAKTFYQYKTPQRESK